MCVCVCVCNTYIVREFVSLCGKIRQNLRIFHIS